MAGLGRTIREKRFPAQLVMRGRAFLNKIAIGAASLKVYPGPQRRFMNHHARWKGTHKNERNTLLKIGMYQPGGVGEKNFSMLGKGAPL